MINCAFIVFFQAVVGSDIAELLLKKKIDMDENEVSEPEEVEVENHIANGALSLSPNDAKVTQKFCDLLLFGHKNGALGMRDILIHKHAISLYRVYIRIVISNTVLI